MFELFENFVCHSNYKVFYTLYIIIYKDFSLTSCGKKMSGKFPVLMDYYKERFGQNGVISNFPKI